MTSRLSYRITIRPLEVIVMIVMVITMGDVGTSLLLPFCHAAMQSYGALVEHCQQQQDNE